MTEERRRHDRDESPVLVADMRVRSNERRVKVRNLSSGGAMVEGVAGLVAGEAVSLNLQNIGWVEGNVAWVLEDRCGVAFPQEIDPLLAL